MFLKARGFGALSLCSAGLREHHSCAAAELAALAHRKAALDLGPADAFLRDLNQLDCRQNVG
jgi:hypothetical protein